MGPSSKSLVILIFLMFKKHLPMDRADPVECREERTGDRRGGWEQKARSHTEVRGLWCPPLIAPWGQNRRTH